jgi:hypothetical protein
VAWTFGPSNAASQALEDLRAFAMVSLHPLGLLEARVILGFVRLALKAQLQLLHSM